MRETNNTDISLKYPLIPTELVRISTRKLVTDVGIITTLRKSERLIIISK